MCEECDGWGEVFTGAKAPNKVVGPCGKCNGNGWTIVARDSSATLGTDPIAQLQTVQNGPPGGGLGLDSWGRPEGHRHWGVPPAQIPG